VSDSRISIQLGDSKFEAQGSEEFVRSQFEVFRQLIAPLPPQSAPAPVESPRPIALEKIMRVRGPIVSLSVPAKPEEAVLALLLGQRHLRRNEVVSGLEIMDGLRQSGLNIRRADTILSKQGTAGTIIAVGRRRSRRYRLSASGIERAENIVRALVPQDAPPSSEQ
jgi:hypothetical protein